MFCVSYVQSSASGQSFEVTRLITMDARSKAGRSTRRSGQSGKSGKSGKSNWSSWKKAVPGDALKKIDEYEKMLSDARKHDFDVEDFVNDMVDNGMGDVLHESDRLDVAYWRGLASDLEHDQHVVEYLADELADCVRDQVLTNIRAFSSHHVLSYQESPGGTIKWTCYETSGPPPPPPPGGSSSAASSSAFHDLDQWKSSDDEVMQTHISEVTSSAGTGTSRTSTKGVWVTTQVMQDSGPIAARTCESPNGCGRVLCDRCYW